LNHGIGEFAATASEPVEDAGFVGPGRKLYLAISAASMAANTPGESWQPSFRAALRAIRIVVALRRLGTVDDRAKVVEFPATDRPTM